MRARVCPAVLRLRRFRASAHRWFAQAPRRLALARLHGQMAALCQVEIDAIQRPYDPRRPTITGEEREEMRHLDKLGDEAHGRMHDLAPGCGAEGFYDFIFGRGTGAP